MGSTTKKTAKKSTPKKDSKTKAATATAEDTEAMPATEESASPQSEASPTCPACEAPMILRSGPYGSFWGCSRYRSGECKATLPVQQ